MNKIPIVILILLLAGAPLLGIQDGGLDGPGNLEPELDPQAAPGVAQADVERLALTVEGTFWENDGQLEDASVVLYAEGPAMSIGFTVEGLVITIHDGDTDGIGDERVSMSFAGARSVRPRGDDPLGFPVALFDGSSPRASITKGYRAVWYEDVYEGIDVVFRMDGHLLKYNVLVAPGADPSDVAIVYQGVESLHLDGTTGELLIGTGTAVLRDAAPTAAQRTARGSVDVDVRFLVEGDRVAFGVGPYDPALPLVIDPALEYSTYIGSDSIDSPNTMTLGEDGYLYLTGVAYGYHFPATHGHTPAAFVMKIDPSDRSIDFCSLLAYPSVQAACMDGSGAFYLAGYVVQNVTFVTPGAFCQTYNGGPTDIYVVKVAPNGTYIEYGTLLGGRGRENAQAMAVDSSGCVYLSGKTSSINFPATPDALSGKYSEDNQQGFLTKFNANGSDVEYSSEYFLGAKALAVDGEDMVYMSGPPNEDYPITPGAYSASALSSQLIKVRSDLTTVEFSTYFDEEILDIEFDGTGDIYLTGRAFGDLNVTSDAFQKTVGGGIDVHITVMNPKGSKLLYATYIGGSKDEFVRSLKLDDAGDVLLVGETLSTDFPTSMGGFDVTHGGKRDGFIVKLSPGETNLTYSTYLGGSEVDYASDVAVLEDGMVVTWGYTESTDFPTTAGASDTTYNDGGDTFLAFVGELVPPELLDDATPSTVGTGEKLRFRINASDNDEVDNVSVEYWTDDPNRTITLKLDLVSGTGQRGTWERELAIGADFPVSLSYRATVLDRTGTFDVGPVRAVGVLDRTRPTFEARVLPQGTTGDPYNLSVVVRDNRAVGAVYAVCWFGDNASAAVNATMTGLGLDALGRGVYFLDGIQVPPNATDPLRYTFAASDAAGNWNATAPLSISITDNDPPSILEDASTATATTDDEFDFAVVVSDNIGISSVKVFYRFGGGAVTDQALDEVSANSGYYYPIHVPAGFQGDLVYTFKVWDTSGLTFIGAQTTRHVIDNDPPGILEDLSDAKATTGDDFTFKVRVGDNIAIAGVNVTYRFGNGTPVDVPLAAVEVNRTYTGTVAIPLDSLADLVYAFAVTDTAGLAAIGDNVTRQVLDNDPPTLLGDMTQGTPSSGDAFTFRVEAADNIGMGRVELRIAFGASPAETHPMRYGVAPRQYATDVAVPLDFAGTVRYSFWALDGSGNSANSTTYTIQAVDGRPPTLGQDGSDRSVIKGAELHLRVNATDNIGVAGVTAAISINEVLAGTLTMTGSGCTYEATFLVARATAFGILTYAFTAVDAAGNSASTAPAMVAIGNIVPVLEIQETWVVVEGQEGALDLSPYLSDGNDPVANLTVSTEDPDVTVAGYVLRVRYDAWRADRVLTVTVSDGESTSTADITLKVVNVNDAPVIAGVAPANGTKYKEGDPVPFNASAADEDGDALTYTWKLEGVAIGQGRELQYKDLEAGEHTVVLEVSDGTATVSRSVQVVVEKRKGEKETPGPSALAALLALAAAAAGTGWVTGSRRR